MISEIAYQNRDQNQTNPLIPATEENSQPDKKKADPKLKILYILGIIIIFLLLISIVISLIRKNQPPKPIIKITPTATPKPEIPNQSGDNIIPLELKNKFQEIDQEINQIIDFGPPQLTDDIVP